MMESRMPGRAVPRMASHGWPDASESARSAARQLAYAPDVAYGSTLSTGPASRRSNLKALRGSESCPSPQTRHGPGNWAGSAGLTVQSPRQS
jgi:hypothetical protein